MAIIFLKNSNIPFISTTSQLHTANMGDVRPLDRQPYFVNHDEHLDRVLNRPQLTGNVGILRWKYIFSHTLQG